MRLLLCLVLCFLSAASYAKPFLIITETTISNDNWYPLPVRDMKAAAADTALAELSANGRFEIKKQSNTSQQHDGNLQLDISLIGPAKIVKLTMSLHLKDKPSYVSSVSMDIHGMDYQGIYNAFEHVGREAAKRLNVKTTMTQKNNNDDNLNNHRQGESVASAIISDYDQAQELKRQEHFHKARVLFEKVVEESSKAERRWSQMAEDELRYGLPIFEADNLLLNNTLQDPSMLMQKMEKVEHLYRQILADNTDKPQRVIEINGRLDNASISRKALANALKANALSGAIPLRLMLQEYYMSMGKWPDETEITEQIIDYAPNFSLVSYQSNKEKLELVVKDNKYGAEIQLAGSGQGVTVQLK